MKVPVVLANVRGLKQARHTICYDLSTIMQTGQWEGNNVHRTISCYRFCT